MDTSTITSKGQVTIPASLRKRLGLITGQRVAFDLRNGHIVLDPVKDDISASFGVLKAARHASSDAMDHAIEQGINARFKQATGSGSDSGKP